MTTTQMIDVFNIARVAIAPETSRHARLVWAAQQIAAIENISVTRAYIAVDHAIAHAEIVAPCCGG